jgi:asparagine synthase (glutamine-hydrolysing)
MFRYIALAWQQRSEEQRLTVEKLQRKLLHSAPDAPAWQLEFSSPGLRVYCCGVRGSSIDVHRLHGGGGVVLGTVFAKPRDSDDTPSNANFSPCETSRLLATHGRHLVERYWGRYVAFLMDRQQNTTAVLRSPSGEIDCLQAEVDGVHLYFSGTEACPLLDSRKLSINWDYVAAELATSLPETRATGLNEITRVLHGECIVTRNDIRTTLTHWNPIDFVTAPRIDDPDEAAKKMRQTTHACISAWASRYSSVLALLSGGLDSSIVVSTLKRARARPRVTCVNYRNPYDTVTDERRYARLVANEAAYPLVEIERIPDEYVGSILNFDGPFPTCQPAFTVPDSRQLCNIASEHGAHAYFLGHGGDQLFFQNGAYFTCADYVFERGLRPSVMSVAMDAARIDGGALWPALRRGIRDGMRRNPLVGAIESREFSEIVQPDVVSGVRSKQLFVPASLRSSQPIPPGKCFQIFGLSMNDGMYGAGAFEDDPELVFPLLSQPLQELCLQIPSYILAIGGRSRGLARLAFRPDVPAEVLNRRTKAFVFDFMKALLEKNLAAVQGLLLDGALVKERIVDARKLQRLLAGDLTKGIGSANDVMHAVASEAWIRTWGLTRTALAA